MKDYPHLSPSLCSPNQVCCPLCQPGCLLGTLPLSSLVSGSMCQGGFPTGGVPWPPADVASALSADLTW